MTLCVDRAGKNTASSRASAQWHCCQPWPSSQLEQPCLTTQSDVTKRGVTRAAVTRIVAFASLWLFSPANIWPSLYNLKASPRQVGALPAAECVAPPTESLGIEYPNRCHSFGSWGRRPHGLRQCTGNEGCTRFNRFSIVSHHMRNRRREAWMSNGASEPPIGACSATGGCNRTASPAARPELVAQDAAATWADQRSLIPSARQSAGHDAQKGRSGS